MPELDSDTLDSLSELSPTDGRILSVLNEGRNVPANISDEIDRSVKHVSTRLTILRENGLVKRVGRENVSLHELTERGRQVQEAHEEMQSVLRGEWR